MSAVSGRVGGLGVSDGGVRVLTCYQPDCLAYVVHLVDADVFKTRSKTAKTKPANQKINKINGIAGEYKQEPQDLAAPRQTCGNDFETSHSSTAKPAMY